MSEIVDVIVLVFADGTTHWFKKKPVNKGKVNPNQEYIDACFSEWRDENREMIKNHPVQNAICTVRMTEEKYNSIVADDRFMNSMDRGGIMEIKIILIAIIGILLIIQGIGYVRNQDNGRPFWF